MAIRVRCRQCTRKIAIDEAFAGGVCRCPYCKGLTLVSRGPVEQAHLAGRPDSPPRPDQPGRPLRPDGPPGVEPPAVDPYGHVPLARPVRVQGIVSLLALGLLLLSLAGGGYFLYLEFRPAQQPPRTGVEDPFAVKGATVMGVKLSPPVVYVLDGSGGMGDMLDLARAVVRHSILSLAPAQKFNVLVVREESIEKLAPDLLAGGADGDARAREFLGQFIAGGATDLQPALTRALDMKPATLVVLTAKGAADPPALAKAARGRKAKIVAIVMGGYAEPVEQWRQIAQQTGGDVRGYSAEQLQALLQAAPALP